MAADSDAFRADSPVDNTPGVELTEEQKASHQRVKDAGWADKVAIDYAQAERDARDGEWLGTGRIYEWNSEEYGEVGPRIPELEKDLFFGEFQQRKGEHMQALELEVAIEGPSNDRVRRVRARPSRAWHHPLTISSFSSRMQVFTPSCWRISSLRSTRSRLISNATPSLP